MTIHVRRTEEAFERLASGEVKPLDKKRRE